MHVTAGRALAAAMATAGRASSVLSGVIGDPLSSLQ